MVHNSLFQHRIGRAIVAVLVVAMVAMVSVSCDSKAPAAKGPRTYPYRITTTVGMLTDIVRQVAGDKAKVTGIIGEGVDPHLYKANRDDVAALMAAEVIFYNGLMLEGKMADTLEKVGRSKPTHAVAERLESQYLLKSEATAGHPDPHVWMDPSAWAKAAGAVADALSEYDPTNAPYYRANAEACIKQIKEVDEYGKRVMASIPETSRILITSHDAFNYFGRAYGIKVMGVQGLSTESEAGLRDINRLVDVIVQNNVKAVFVESSVPQKNIQALIDGARVRGREVRIGGELFSDAMGSAGTYEGTYIGMLDHNLTTVTRALGGQAPERGMQGKLRQR